MLYALAVGTCALCSVRAEREGWRGGSAREGKGGRSSGKLLESFIIWGAER